MAIKQEIIDELLKDYKSPEDLLGEAGLFKVLKKALVERALSAELTDHLGYEAHDPGGRKSGNSRNGHGSKRITGEDGDMTIAVPRDRDSSFEPQIIRKGQRRFDGFDDKIISMYARGMTVREIRGHLEELYGVEVSPDLISRVTDEVMDEVREWQTHPLDEVYPIIIFDALRVKIRGEGTVRKAVASDLKAVYRVATADEAARQLDEFEDKWGARFPSIAPIWRRNREQVIPFFAYPEDVRKIIYTTNAIESLNMSLRKIIKNRGHFPSDDAATKLLYLALRNAAKKWTMPSRTWKQALNQFAVLFHHRFPSSIY